MVKKKLYFRLACAFSSSIIIGLFLTFYWTFGSNSILLLFNFLIAMVFGVPLGIIASLVFGNILWIGMERRYEATLALKPTDTELQNYQSSDRRLFIVMALVVLAFLTVLLPEGYHGLFTVLFGLASLTLVYAIIRNQNMDINGRSYPLTYPPCLLRIALMILGGVGFIAVGVYYLYQG